MPKVGAGDTAVWREPVWRHLRTHRLISGARKWTAMLRENRQGMQALMDKIKPCRPAPGPGSR
jgi:hypothetical protein